MVWKKRMPVAILCELCGKSISFEIEMDRTGRISNVPPDIFYIIYDKFICCECEPKYQSFIEKLTDEFTNKINNFKINKQEGN